MRAVLDTHILVYWVSEPDRLTPAQSHVVKTITPENPAIVADITLWEIAMLASTGCLTFQLPIQEWITRAVSPPLVRVAEITSNIAADVADLSDWEHRDPADRLIVATARVYGARLLTNDERIRSSGLVEVV
ncbi:MAG: type II toxin-antitoxin system VapC family toxin [Alkalispirochaeta sp.]